MNSRDISILKHMIRYCKDVDSSSMGILYGKRLQKIFLYCSNTA